MSESKSRSHDKVCTFSHAHFFKKCFWGHFSTLHKSPQRPAQSFFLKPGRSYPSHHFLQLLSSHPDFISTTAASYSKCLSQLGFCFASTSPHNLSFRNPSFASAPASFRNYNLRHPELAFLPSSLHNYCLSYPRFVLILITPRNHGALGLFFPSPPRIITTVKLVIRPPFHHALQILCEKDSLPSLPCFSTTVILGVFIRPLLVFDIWLLTFSY